MQVSVQKLSPVLLELNIQVPAGRVSEELERAYGMVARNAKVRGFRPGKAPRSVLMHMFGNRVAADVAQRLVEETYSKAVNEHNVQAVSEPAIESRQIVENQPFSYKARVEIIPEIESVNFSGFKVTRPKVEVTDALIDAELLKLRRQVATLEPLKEDRAAKEGDIAILDFDVEVAGKPVVDANARDLEVEVGKGNLLPGIEAAIVGKKAGERAEVEIEMPPSHPHPSLRGKKATIKLLAKDLKVRVIPELDNELAKDLGNFGSLDELKKSISEQLEKQLKEQSETKLAEQLVEALVAANTIDVPPSLVQRQAQMTEQELLQQARRSGQSPSIPQELRASIVRDSEVKVRAGLLMAAIAKQEQIKIGDTEIEEGLTELAAQTGKNIAKVRAEYGSPKKREMLVGMILENKVLDLIESKSNIEEG
ncbi:MAG TPA: trigger factor [Polyangiaceae bacterium]|nr:trigger factor [Polyangiaceae bacterium]